MYVHVFLVVYVDNVVLYGVDIWNQDISQDSQDMK
jgi:hypothetical protein